MSVENPLKWLLAALPGYIEPEHLAVLMERYETNKRAYAHASKIRQVERQIATLKRRNSPREAVDLARWQAKLDKLKEEQ